MFPNLLTPTRAERPAVPLERRDPFSLGRFPVAQSSETRSVSLSQITNQKREEKKTKHYLEGSESSILRRILDPGVNLCVWQREPHKSAQLAVEALQTSAHSLAIHTTSANLLTISTALRAVVNNPDIRVRIGLDWLASDAIQLASLFSDLSGAKRIRIHLERVEDDGCSVFHEENLSVRLVCIYAGQGIQWAPEELVCREELEAAKTMEVSKANKAILPDANSTRTVPSWHVGVYAGKKWRPGLTSALVHRSAPVGTQKDFRLRLIIDDLSSAC